ncbi:MAG: hypothetical protein J5809_07705 [Selenomonadaceae bacterium]|nr:hypothetical protein [Selenomonadaceae bacterium]
MTNEELISRGIKCLIENLGYIEAGEFLRQIAQNDDQPADYTEWRRENLFKGMSDKEILAGAIKYSEIHNLK